MQLLGRAFGRSRTGPSGTERTLSTSTPTPVRWAFQPGRYSKSDFESSPQNKKRVSTESSGSLGGPDSAWKCAHVDAKPAAIDYFVLTSHNRSINSTIHPQK